MAANVPNQPGHPPHKPITILQEWIKVLGPTAAVVIFLLSAENRTTKLENRVDNLTSDVATLKQAANNPSEEKKENKRLKQANRALQEVTADVLRALPVDRRTRARVKEKLAKINPPPQAKLDDRAKGGIMRGEKIP